MKITKLMVANRGEIAIRVLRAATELGVRTVAIYTYEDRYSLHRYKADEAYQVGKDADPLKPYLDIEEIIRVAKREGVNAIHPGYGFLSENVQFAKRCREEDIIFIGPDPEVMEQLGDKIAAKKVAVATGVPVIPDNKQALTSVDIALAEARAIGYPIMLKSAAGGGGRGMRRVYSDDALIKGFNEAKREAGNAFGDDTLFMEKFVVQPKHIEVQILGDQFGNIVHLYERDCSLQRRFQKVIEIAPAPNLPQEVRDKLYDYALRIARHVHYNNAGTVEFLVDKEQNIYFIEVNPRIQVEHTVTEVITGIDIVRSQILIASGHRLDSSGIFIPSQETVALNGFAVQCRITTEDPTQDFKPDYGTVIAYRNAGGFGIRIDEGSSYPGVKISPFFDSMLAKITASGRTFKGTIQRMRRTLAEFRIRGVKTNIAFLENILDHPDFQEGNITVNFLEEHPQVLQFPPKLDRGTRILKYLAEVCVNGNPDVKHYDPNRKFITPVIPDYDEDKKPADGTKQLLDSLGPEKFAQWLKSQKQVMFTDTTMRDAHQSLLATRVRTTDMMKVAASYAQNHPQTFSMEVWGGATFDVAMRFLYEDPWKRLQLLREAMPNILLQMLLRGSNAVGYTSYPDNLVEKFIEEAWKNGNDVFRIFDSLNWVDSMLVSIKTVRERTGGIAEAAISYTGDILDPKKTKYNLQYYLDLARRLEDAGAHILGIKDMTGLLKPYAAALLVSELKKVIDIPIHLHTHDTSSVQAATYIKAIEAGVDVVDVALGSMSGLTSQPNFESLVESLRNTPYATDFNLDSLHQFSDYWENVREIYYPFESGLKAGTAQVYRNEIPGGQYSNLRPQAFGLGLGEKLPAIKKAYEEVNELFGDVVKVTPSSKVVGDMAMFMVTNNLTKEDIFNKGATLSFPQSVIGYFRGDIGQPYGGFPETLQKIILKDIKPYTDLPNKHLEPVDFDKEYAAFKEKFGKEVQMTDFLSYKLYPKVFEDYFNHKKEYGDVSVIPTPYFFYGLRQNEEILITIDKGKSIMVRLLNILPADENGMRPVFFRLNGQTRVIECADKNVEVKKVSHKKVSGESEIGAPLQGMLARIFVKAGDAVKKNQPLFTIEAMKMETTITASAEGKIKAIVLAERTMVEADDVVLEME